MSLNRQMSDKHEEYLSDLIGDYAKVTRGSGNQAAQPTDVRMSRWQSRFSFAIEAKSTRAASFSVTRKILKKLKDQSHGERPALGIRFYDDDRLQGFEDWVLVTADDYAEMMEELNG